MLWYARDSRENCPAPVRCWRPCLGCGAYSPHGCTSAQINSNAIDINDPRYGARKGVTPRRVLKKSEKKEASGWCC
jgi:hypothetical protein